MAVPVEAHGRESLASQPTEQRAGTHPVRSQGSGVNGGHQCLAFAGPTPSGACRHEQSECLCRVAENLGSFHGGCIQLHPDQDFGMLIEVLGFGAGRDSPAEDPMSTGGRGPLARGTQRLPILELATPEAQVFTTSPILSTLCAATDACPGCTTLRYAILERARGPQLAASDKRRRTAAPGRRRGWPHALSPQRPHGQQALHCPASQVCRDVPLGLAVCRN